MSKMPPTCRHCFENDATAFDGWCDECAGLFDCPDEEDTSAGWATDALRAIFAPPSREAPDLQNPLPF